MNELAIERARRGAELLDRKMPDWANRIDLDNLDMGSCTSCVIGQALGCFGPAAVEGLGLDWYSHDDAWHGFTGGPISESVPYGDLEAAWAAEVRRRRGDAP